MASSKAAKGERGGSQLERRLLPRQRGDGRDVIIYWLKAKQRR